MSKNQTVARQCPPSKNLWKNQTRVGGFFYSRPLIARVIYDLQLTADFWEL
jgi:hypothetical protein